MSDLLEFFRAVFSNWLATVGVILTILSFFQPLIEKYFKWTVSARILWTIGGICLLIAIYQAWSDEHQKAVQASNSELLLQRQQHLNRLQAVLKKDATNLLEVARRLNDWEGQVADTSQASYQADFDSFWRPEVLSDDIKNHFKEYAEEKEMLRHQVEMHDQTFRDTLHFAEKLITPTNLSEHIRKKVAIAYLDKCRGKGPGIELRISPDSFGWSWHGGSGGSSGPNVKPPEDIISTLKTFESFKPDAALVSRCASLTEHTKVIAEKAKNLSQKALTLAERTYLYGTCPYLDTKNK
jgi:hypothetical protein